MGQIITFTVTVDVVGDIAEAERLVRQHIDELNQHRYPLGISYHSSYVHERRAESVSMHYSADPSSLRVNPTGERT